MSPAEPVRLQILLIDVTDHVTRPGEAGPPEGTPPDADDTASGEALRRILSLVESLGGVHGRKTSSERGEREGAFTRQEVEKTIAAFEDGVLGRQFVAGAWPIAAGWLANKESRSFRIKYGEGVVDLRGPEDVDRALGLMKDAVAAPRAKAKPKASRRRKRTSRRTT